MGNHLAKLGFFRFLLVQFALILCVACVFWAFAGLSHAYSSLLGGLVCVLPNYCFAYFAFRYKGATRAKQIVQSFYLGESLKIIFAAVLFAVIFITLEIAPGVFFGTFLLAQLMLWLAPLFLKTSN